MFCGEKQWGNNEMKFIQGIMVKNAGGSVYEQAVCSL